MDKKTLEKVLERGPKKAPDVQHVKIFHFFSNFLRIKDIIKLFTERNQVSVSEMDLFFDEEKVMLNYDIKVKPLFDIPKKTCKTFEFIVDYNKITAFEGETIYRACERHFNDISMYIPTLCNHPLLPEIGACGVCTVKLLGKDGTETKMVKACKTLVKEGMVIETARIDKVVRKNVEEILQKKLANHCYDCIGCELKGRCTFKTLLSSFEVTPKFGSVWQKEEKVEKVDVDGDVELILKKNKCVECYRCVRACSYIQNMCVFKIDDKNIPGDIEDLHFVGEENLPEIHSLKEFHEKMSKTYCIHCGLCSFVCPVGSITTVSANNEIQKLLIKKKRSLMSTPFKKIIVAQIAPTSRTTIPEEYDMDPGTIPEEKLVEGLRKLGFDYVFDTNSAADVTIIEEIWELLERKRGGGALPMFTSCCPAWINFAESYSSDIYPDILPHISTCKSPHQMMGALIKNYWRVNNKNISDGKEIIVVSIMPCLAKKNEIKRAQLRSSVGKDVDFVLSVRELKRMFDKNGIKINRLSTSSNFDDIFGNSSGSGQILGTTGGLTEAGLRTAGEFIFKTCSSNFGVMKLIKETDFGDNNVKICEVKMKVPKEGNEIIIKTAVAYQMKNATRLLREMKNESELLKDLDFVEIMACNHGCVGGAGNPKFLENKSTIKKRKEAIYRLGNERKFKGEEYLKSHENVGVIKMYKDFFTGEYGSLKKLIHTYYSKRKVVLKGRVQFSEMEEEEKMQIQEKIEILEGLYKKKIEMM